MKRTDKKIVSLLLALALIFALCAPALAVGEGKTAPLDYADAANWAYFEDGSDKDVDVFLICPTVDTRSETNSFDLNDKLKGRFVSALDAERGIYDGTGRMFSPYYRQMSINAYRLSEEARSAARKVAYADVSDAFKWYLENVYDGRGIILAGFSQGADMCLELLKEYFGEGSEELRGALIAVYAIGWAVTEEMAAQYPQIAPAQGETDTGVVVSFDCEDGTLTDSIVIPAGQKALSINPLNWMTDSTPAGSSLNLGAVMATGAEPLPGLCGAYIGPRGELVVTGVSAEEYPPAIDVFQTGAFHIYDNMFFYTNLKNNVAARTNAWRTGLPFGDVAADTWYTDAVGYVYEKGLMNGTGAAAFSPDLALTRAQLTTVLWRCAGEPVVNYAMPYSDVPADTWYTEAVRWAAAEKMTDRADGTFAPDEELTRAETAALLWNFAKSLGADVSVGEDPSLSGFSDAQDIEPEYVQAMQWAVGAGVIRGTGEATLSPNARLSRSQAAVMLMRFGAAA